MLEAANYGGRIIEITKTSFIHALSYGLTERYNIPHGLACGIMLSYFDNDAKKLLKQLNIDRHFIMCRVDVDWLIDRAMESERFNNKTFKLTKRKLLRILK